MPLLVTRAFRNKKDKAFLSNTHIYYSKGFLRRKGENCILNIFSEVKEYLTARQVAENYGLQVRRNGLACCPFHDDKHPNIYLSLIFCNINSYVNHKNSPLKVFDTVLGPQMLFAVVNSFQINRHAVSN